MIGRWAFIGISVLLIGCGDNIRQDELFEAASGSHLKLEWYLYQDGTRQPAAGAFYDVELHARCTPQPWGDDVVRCVPFAQPAMYADATCMTVVGPADPITMPAFFLAADSLGGPLPRLYRAGQPSTTITQHYELQAGACLGPFSSLPDVRYYELTDEISASELVPLRDTEIGEARIGVRVRETDDGLRVPIGLHDRELDLECTAAQPGDTSIGCVPTTSVVATYFRDAGCGERAVLVDEGVSVPVTATVTEPSGCASYYTVGPQVSGPLYRRDRDACVQMAVTPVQRLFSVGPQIDPPTMEQIVEDVRGRRLQRIILSTGEFRFVGDRLFDTATRAECERTAVGEVTRCMPSAMATGTLLYASGCELAMHVVELPLPSCERYAFATTTSEAGIDIRAIGDRISATLYRLGAGGCQPYASPSGSVLRALGPPIAADTFVSAVSFGER